MRKIPEAVNGVIVSESCRASSAGLVVAGDFSVTIDATFLSIQLLHSRTTSQIVLSPNIITAAVSAVLEPASGYCSSR
jgi:hypothetical protein